ncbi:hypothetical protein [Sphingobacterium bovistauri]|uniref:YcxB-like protein n=1 Tax=Sphingobacterium bovistauri TaxID=2781959 RepID=A0ABS7Z5B6_9SPHI|nr:hypothetical protein [Sphingobacterium bovistauri]MCA5004586.1 hypothetical protein [Sphingobacterium bovistauri]
MGKYTYEDNVLTIWDKQPNIFARIVLYFLTAVFFIIAICTILFPLFSGMGLHIGNILGLGFFGYLTYILLKMSLWNTKGKETIVITNNELKYSAHYYLFKGNSKIIELDDIFFDIYKEYPDDNFGALKIIDISNNSIETASKLDIETLNELIVILNTRLNLLNKKSNSV